MGTNKLIDVDGNTIIDAVMKNRSNKRSRISISIVERKRLIHKEEL